MIISLLSIAVVLMCAYVWLGHGFYSALINFVCVLIAGAVAFAVWEPVSLAILDFGGTNSFLDSSAWALGLALPFGITVALLRVVLDAVLRANVAANEIVNYVGGALLGLLSGVIVSGIMVISLSYMRVDYVNSKSFEYGAGGNLKRAGQLWVPFDKIVTKTYAFLSLNGFSTDEPLAELNPHLYENGNAMRLSAFDSKGRNTAHPDEFVIAGRFTVGDPSGKSNNFESLLSDAWRPSGQSVTDPNGDPFPANSHIEGVLVNFKAGSKEKDGKTAVGAAQVSLLLQGENGESKMVFPIAVSSQSTPELPAIARWRYDAKDVFIASIGGGSDALFAFEFPCPPGFSPKAIYVKGIRAMLNTSGKQPDNYATASDRDRAIASGFGVNPGAPIVGASTGAEEDTFKVPTKGPQGVNIPGVQTGPNLISGVVLQRGAVTQGQLELDAENQNAILRGESVFDKAELKDTQGLEKSLKINKLSTTSDANIVWLNVSASSRTSLLGKSLDVAEQVLPPLLVDTLGTQYQPVGYMYQDETTFKLVYDPGQPIQAMSQLPSLSRSRPAQTLWLIFRVSSGRDVKTFNRGSKVVNEFDPPFRVDAPGR